MPCAGGSGPHSARGRICSQVARPPLPAELGQGAETGLRTPRNYSLRNVAAFRYLGNHVSLRLSECVGVRGKLGGELRVRQRWCDWRGGGCVSAVDSCVGEDDSSLSVGASLTGSTHA